MITFDKATHRYAVDGIALPGVNEILKDLRVCDLSRVPPGILEKAAALGTAVHQATALDDSGVLDDASLGPECVPYFTAWKKFKRENDYSIHAIEKSYTTSLFGGFCGTVDRLCRLNGTESVIDIKTGGTYRSTRLQTAAYSVMAREGKTCDVARSVLYLQKDGTYCIQNHTDKEDYDVWGKCVELFHWKHPRYKKAVDFGTGPGDTPQRDSSDPWIN